MLLLLACSHATPYVRAGDTGQASAAPRAGRELDHRLLLIGDAGAPRPDGEPVLGVLAERAAAHPGRTTVVFLGDNIYERGMPPPGHRKRADAERRLEAQLEALRRAGAPGVFVPGNHDWGGPDGWERIREQDAYLRAVDAAGQIRVTLLPRGGCPGPAQVPLGRTGTLLALDSDWWLESGSRPQATANATGCAHLRVEDVQAALAERLAAAAADGRRSIVAMHHPLKTLGPHGGFVDWRAHVFPASEGRGSVPVWLEWVPAPVVASIIAWTRSSLSPSPQDIANGTNRRMRNDVEAPLREAASAGWPPLLHASGHDHSLQVFEGDGGADFLLVSGLGSRLKQTRVGHDDHTLFAHAAPQTAGFAQVDFFTDGGVRLDVVEVDPDRARPEGRLVFGLWLVP